jgi:hypothetical protein
MQRRRVGWTGKDKLEKMWKETVIISQPETSSFVQLSWYYKGS